MTAIGPDSGMQNPCRRNRWRNQQVAVRGTQARCGSPTWVTRIHSFRDFTNLTDSRGRFSLCLTVLRLEIKAIEIHHLVPGRNEVLHELLLCIVARVDLCEGAQLGASPGLVGRCNPELSICRAEVSDILMARTYCPLCASQFTSTPLKD